MASLQELLVEEGFERQKKLTKNHHQKKVKFRDRRARDESIVLPIYVCHERRRSFDAPKQKIDNRTYSRDGSVMSASTRRGPSDSGKSIVESIDEGFLRRNEPAIDEVAVRAVVSILSGYIGQYLRDEKFRENTKAKCFACFTRNKDSGDAYLKNIESGIENVERLAEDQGHQREVNMKSLQYCISLLSSTVASLNSKNSKNGTNSGTKCSHLAACAQLYLSIVYKIHKSDRISARHLLQVFCDSPFIARTHLLPEVWEHLFLPHLLHIKIWYTEEVESLSNSMYLDWKETKMKGLEMAYNEQMDIGTEKFAHYYKEWLKDGAKAPAVPSVPLPSILNHVPSRRRYSDSFTSNFSSKSSLYRAIFGPILERKSTDLNDKHGDLNYHSSSEEQKKFPTKEHNIDMETRSLGSQRSSSISHRKAQSEAWLDDKKSDYFRLLSCRSDTSEHVGFKDSTLRIASNGKEKSRRFSMSNDLRRAIRTICISDSLSECEKAIRLITKAWLDSHGDPTVENAVSNAQVIEAILEVLSASSDDEILELAISILAQIVTKKELNANIILNFDPQLDIFLRLLRNNSLFLKASVLLYLAKPKAKQMIAMEWIPLVLRVLEFADQSQTLFTIQCSPQVAAYYFLDQLLNCFDEDKNMENAGYIVSLGGLNLLLRRMEIGDTHEMNKATSIIYSCILADRSCRYCLAQNLNKECLISLLAHRNKTSQGQAFALLTELFCLNRHHQRTALLNDLTKGWGRMNTLHILLVYLQRAQPEERPLVAALLLHMDLLGDPNRLGRVCSVYREEAVEEIVKALDCQVLNEKVQEQSSKALLMLGGHFSYTGEPTAEKWLLKQAGFDENSLDSFSINKVAVNKDTNLIREDEAAENWQKSLAMVLLKSGRRNLLLALSETIANGIPCLARASLITVSWISSFLHSSGERSLQSLACSTLVPQLLEALNYDKTMEERILASFSLLSLLKGSDYINRLKTMINGELMNELDKLSQVTWTAKELISIITSN